MSHVISSFEIKSVVGMDRSYDLASEKSHRQYLRK